MIMPILPTPRGWYRLIVPAAGALTLGWSMLGLRFWRRMSTACSSRSNEGVHCHVALVRSCLSACFASLRDYGVMAIARSGLPEPPTILSGAAITTAPTGGSWSRLMRLVMPNLPLPCMIV